MLMELIKTEGFSKRYDKPLQLWNCCWKQTDTE